MSAISVPLLYSTEVPYSVVLCCRGLSHVTRQCRSHRQIQVGGTGGKTMPDFSHPNSPLYGRNDGQCRCENNGTWLGNYGYSLL